MIRRLVALLAALLLVGGIGAVGAVGAPGAGAVPATPPPGGHTDIVGGTQADPGEFPWTAALIRRGASRSSGFTCGASILSRSWLITAAHCVIDYSDAYPDSTYGIYVAPSHLDVLTGTNSIVGTDGQRLQVVAIYPHPSYDPSTNDDDVALLRIGRPTTAPEIAVIGTSSAEQAIDDPGNTATVAGWGVTSEGSGTPAPYLRSVDVPIQSDATCASAYPPGFTSDGELLEYHGANMICAGPLSGGKDSCQGDSGGPLAVQAPDTSWRLVGLVSFGLGCAEPGYPGIYHRLTATSSWVARTRRFGPFNPDAKGYITQQYRDFVGRPPTASELSSWSSNLQDAPAADLISSLQAASPWDGNAGMNVRLYRAAFLRNPDTKGLDYWVRRRWAGIGPITVAANFAGSSEFKTKYGSLSNHDFVTLIYQNVFSRDPDPNGRAYWEGKLAAGRSRGQMLYELSNSSEYRRKTDVLVRIITTRFGLLRAVPTAAEITTSEAMTQRTLIDTLRTSLRYASRFDG